MRRQVYWLQLLPEQYSTGGLLSIDHFPDRLRLKDRQMNLRLHLHIDLFLYGGGVRLDEQMADHLI